MREIKKKKDQLPEELKHKAVPVHIKNQTLFINKKPVKQHIKVPTIQEVFNMSVEEQTKSADIVFTSSESTTDKGSVFKGHTLRINNSTDIHTALKKLKLLYPESNHMIFAYRMKSYTGFDDDGEYGAGRKLLNILEDGNFHNTLLFITREYGGIHLGQHRFLHIEKVAKEAVYKLIRP